jgi:adenosylcobinamide-GDP ribazoletransferase
VLGRWSTLPQSLAWSPARPQGSGSLVRASPRAVAVTTLLCAALAVVVAGTGPGSLAIAVAASITAALGGGLARTLGGVTGDSFGAVNKVVEIATYVTLAAAWS